MDTNKKPSIVITGEGPHLGQIAELASCVDPEFRGWVGGGGISKNWLWACGNRGVNSSLELDSNVAVIGGSTNENNGFIFPPQKNIWHIPQTTKRVYHPSIFADLIPLDLSGKVVACGYPGSGNGIVQTLLESIIAKAAQKEKPSPVVTLIAAYVADYRQKLDSTLSSLNSTLVFDALPQWATYMDVDASVRLYSQGNSSAIFGLPIRNYVCERVHKSHEPFGTKISSMILGGAECILTVRNPLNTIVSIANKVAADGIDLLGIEWLFRMVARGLISYYRSFFPALENNQIHCIRYEEVQTHFERISEFLGSLCNVELLVEEIGTLKDRLLSKPVSLPGHLWQPEIAEKWRLYLSGYHLGILWEEGIDDIFGMLGYESVKPNQAVKHPSTLKISPYEPVLPGLLLHCAEKNTTAVLDELSRLCGCVHHEFDSVFFVIATSPNILESVNSFMSESDFTNLVRAGRI